MKCYVHLDEANQEADAAGLCTVCGRAICHVHSVMIGGKLFCKSDADRQFGKTPVGVTIISILVFLGGAFFLLAGISIIVVSFFFTQFFPSTTGFETLFFRLFAVSFLIAAAASIMTGLGLLRHRIWGWWLAFVGGLGVIGFSIYSSLVRPLLSTTEGIASPVSAIGNSMPVIVIVGIIITYLVYRRSLFGRVTTISIIRLITSVAFALFPIVLFGIITTFLPPPDFFGRATGGALGRI